MGAKGIIIHLVHKIIAVCPSVSSAETVLTSRDKSLLHSIYGYHTFEARIRPSL